MIYVELYTYKKCAICLTLHKNAVKGFYPLLKVDLKASIYIEYKEFSQEYHNTKRSIAFIGCIQGVIYSS